MPRDALAAIHAMQNQWEVYQAWLWIVWGTRWLSLLWFGWTTLMILGDIWRKIMPTEPVGLDLLRGAPADSLS